MWLSIFLRMKTKVLTMVSRQDGNSSPASLWTVFLHSLNMLVQRPPISFWDKNPFLAFHHDHKWMILFLSHSEAWATFFSCLILLNFSSRIRCPCHFHFPYTHSHFLKPLNNLSSFLEFNLWEDKFWILLGVLLHVQTLPHCSCG